MEYVFFPGCKVLTSDPYMEHSTKRVLKEFDVFFIEETDFSCCGPTLVSSLDQTSALALNARNLCVAEEPHHKDIFTLCSWCYKTLNDANHLLKEKTEARNAINAILKDLGKEYKGTIEVKNILEILYDNIGGNNLKAKFKKSLSNLRVAAFLGCHLRGRSSDEYDESYVSNLDRIITLTGAQNINFKEKFQCCGGLVGHLAAIETKFSDKILDSLNKLRVDAIIVSCPYCYSRFNEAIIESKQDGTKDLKIDVLYLPDLIGLAMGLSPEEMALDKRLNDLEYLKTKI